MKALRDRTLLLLRQADASAAKRMLRRLLPAPVRSMLHRFGKWALGRPLHLLLPRTPAPDQPVRVVIYGSFADDWIPRFAEPETWHALADVTEVLILPEPEPERQGIPPAGDPRARTVVIPLSEDDIVRCPRDWPMLAPTAEAVAVLRDKAAFADHVERTGLAALCPAIYRTADAVRFPCVVKPAQAAFGTGIRIFRSRAAFEPFLATAGWDPARRVCQELVDGAAEYSTHCIFERGRLLWSCSFVFERLGGDEIRRGVEFDSMREIPSPASALDAATRLLGPLGYSGPCNLDYKLPSPERIALFEINPRLGGSLMLARNLPHLRAALRCLIDHAG